MAARNPGSRGREHLALARAELARQMTPAVEPDIADMKAVPDGFEERESAADVIGVDVRQDEKLEELVPLRQRHDSASQLFGGLLRSAVDQEAMGIAITVAVLDPQSIAVPRRQHGNVEEGARPRRTRWRGRPRPSGGAASGEGQSGGVFSIRLRNRGEWWRRLALGGN
jgi:hypothetical protein